MKRTPAPAAAGIMRSRTLFAIALLAAAAGFGLPCARAYGESANTDLKQGQAAEAREDYDTAVVDYQKALKKNPKDVRVKIALARVRVTASSMHVTNGRKLEQAGYTQGAIAERRRPDCPSRPRQPRNSRPSSRRRSSSRFRMSRSRCT